MLLLKRMRQRALVFVALFVVIAVATGVSVGILGYLGTSESDGVRSQLAQRSGADAALELTLASESDAEAQDARVDSLLSRVFSTGGRVLPVDVFSSTRSALPVQLSIGVKAFVSSIPDLESRATLVEGSWPASADEVTVQADAAAELGLASGDQLDVGDASVTVTGTWRVTDPQDPRWVGDPLFLSGRDGVVPGPIAVLAETVPAIGADTRTTWAIVPEVAPLQAGDLDVIIDGWDGISDAMRADGGFDLSGLDTGGRFTNTAEGIQKTVDALGAVAPMTLLVVAAIAALTLVELARLLCGLRASEWQLFWSRGDSVLALAGVTAVEAACVSAVAAVSGTAVGALLRVRDPTLPGFALWLIPLAATLAATVAFAATSLVALRMVARRDPVAEGGRAARLTGIAGSVLLTLAAAVSTGQLLLYGSPLVPGRDGGVQVDPSAVLAPALVLLALISIALTVFPALVWPVARRAERSTGLALVSRTLARRTRVLAAPLVLCALACGLLTIAAGYAATWDTAYATTSVLRAGSELTVNGSRAPLTEEVFADLSATDGVSATAAVYAEPVVVGDTPASMVAVTPAALRHLGESVADVVDSPALADLISVQRNGPVIPAGTRELSVTATTDSSGSADLSVLVADGFGVQSEFALQSDPSAEGGQYRAALPTDDDALTVLAFIIRRDSDGPTSLTVTSLTADDRAVTLGTGWTATGFTPFLTDVTSADDAAGFSDAIGLTAVRLSPTLANQTDTLQPPVVISSALADAAAIRVGDLVPVAFDSRVEPLPCVVAAIVPAVPGAGTDSGILLDAGVVEALRARVYDETPTPRVAWIGSDDPAAAVDAVRDAVPAGAIVDSLGADSDRDILSSAATALWIGAAGAGVLALVALIAVVGAQLRSRRGEAGVLRAVGLSDGELSGTRRAELGIVLAAGAVAGVAAGAVVTVLTIPALARAAVPDSYATLATAVGFEPLGLAVGLGTLGIAFGAVLLVYGRRVAR